ncbi:hypothetical protein FIBSPDRAFT_189757 [Athelia psychrophila]|uniref:Secreted protein n=1 Tax=Athelia psychrophila TaxID=1759441 RepID=A0A166A4M3_9AGAM|nr:hypothetical protein FIBSPDRAFT_189757 [Fibularhizoctonia sp. CBS 109695]
MRAPRPRHLLPSLNFLSSLLPSCYIARIIAPPYLKSQHAPSMGRKSSRNPVVQNLAWGWGCYRPRGVTAG